MARRYSVLLSVLFFVLVISGSGHEPARPQAEVRLIRLTRTVRIPVSMQEIQPTGKIPLGDPATLMVSPGAQDEPPNGPAGFDVLDDGSLLICDPLRDSVSVFDGQGKFREAWKIGFAADSLTVGVNGLILVREASTGQLHVLDRQGRSRPTESATLPQAAEARVLTGHSGTVTVPPIGSAGGRTIEVRFDKPGLRLLSIEGLGTDSQGNIYVALETTTGGEETEGINLNKSVRKYAANGMLVCEVTDIPLDYYVTPVDELRVRKGFLYQLMTGRSEVHINVWDMN